jgi:hypothetical protein
VLRIIACAASWVLLAVGSLVPMSRTAGEQIRLEGPDPDGTMNRWMFTDITASSFTWTGLESTDQGTTWHLRLPREESTTSLGWPFYSSHSASIGLLVSSYAALPGPGIVTETRQAVTRHPGGAAETCRPM